jgi:RNA methyltransferase, TrmH family
MPIQQLTSRDNPVLQTIRLVSSGSRRAPKDLVIAEGVRVLEEVERAGSELQAVVFSEDFGVGSREKELLDHWQDRCRALYRIGGNLFQSVSTVQTPQGAIALVRVPELPLASVRPESGSLILYACGVQDPGNIGTLIRTAAAAGAGMVCTTPGTVSARNPKAIRSSAGTFFRLPVVEHAEPSEFRQYCERHAIRLYRTDAREGVLYTEADLKSPCAILVGNEGAGISPQDFTSVPAVRIPMAEGAESLNVAVAGAIVLFEAFRQRLYQK